MRPLAVRRDGDRVLVADGEGTLLAEAGPAADVELTAPSVTAAEVLWAALDCPSGIAAAEAVGLPDGTAVVLGRMAATVAARPRAGTPCRVVAWPGRVEGRKLAAASALVGPGGEVLAAARTLWLTLVRPPGPA
jgi:hypothetical protein